MKSPSPTQRGRKKPSPKPAAVPPPRPMRPWRKTFVGLLIVFGVWIAILLGLYFTSTAPEPPHGAPAERLLRD